MSTGGHSNGNGTSYPSMVEPNRPARPLGSVYRQQHERTTGAPDDTDPAKLFSRMGMPPNMGQYVLPHGAEFMGPRRVRKQDRVVALGTQGV